MKVTVFGAAGHTGRFVLAELLRRGHAPIAVARDVAQLAGCDIRVERRTVAFDDAASLDRCLRDARVAINCAGPFLESAAPLVEAALRCGVAYSTSPPNRRARGRRSPPSTRRRASAALRSCPRSRFSARLEIFWPPPRWVTGRGPIGSRSASRSTVGGRLSARARRGRTTPYLDSSCGRRSRTPATVAGATVALP